MTRAALRVLDLRGRRDELRTILPRPIVGGDEPAAAVAAIVADVRRRGDAAVAEHTRRFDGVDLDTPRVEPSAIASALARLPADVAAALQAAHHAIEHFHRAEAARPHRYERDGIRIRSIPQPVDRAGIYVPGGLAAYPSTVLMDAVPARVAGVPEIVLCLPPGPDGSVPDACLAAAHLAGVDEVYRIGGAQAIAAMAYGTETIRPVDVIAGPGNVYVALAKQQVAGDVGVAAAFAGPSEIAIIADASAPTGAVAIDLVVQAEHGPGGIAWLITWEPAVADAVNEAVAELVAASPRRAEIEATFAEGGYVALVDGPDAALEVANLIAPEHLQLVTADPEALVPSVRHAGAVFCGPWTPASLGDYIAGPSHTLPTNGSARFAGALTVDDFQKRMHVIEADRAAFERVRPHVAALAMAEGLPAHAESVTRRVELVEGTTGPTRSPA